MTVDKSYCDTNVPGTKFKINAIAFGAGVVRRMTNTDTLLPLPPIVHYAAAGAAADYYCKGSVQPDSVTAMAAATALAGGFLVGAVLR